MVDSKRSLTLESTLGDVPVSDTPNNQGLGQKSFSILNWNLLTSPGLSLRNEKNNCWYHATLHFLSVFPPFSESLNYNEQVSEFPRRFTDAISAIVRKQNLTPINHLFELIKDFQGVNNRYGQIAVPDFLEYLSTQITSLFDLVRFQLTTKLQCLKCKWISYRISHDLLFKLYIPPGSKTKCSISQLFDYNTSADFLDQSISCGKCCQRTGHQLSYEHQSDIIMLEIIRVSEKKRGNRITWRKNMLPISFPTSGISVPGTDRKYQVVASCHHRGTLRSGHWITKLMIADRNWHEFDDLRSDIFVTQAPGVNDSSVVVLFLRAESTSLR